MSAPKKSLGQHWLRDTSILSAIVEASEVSQGDNVLEVGPGQGTLTSVLLSAGVNLTAVEYDFELFEELGKNINRFPNPHNLKIVNEDILKFDLTKLPKDYKVVANIPYYLTSNLIRLLSESKNPPRSITLLVQKEVAERICAAPGQMSLLSVSAQNYYEVKLDIIVPAEEFIPPPKVDSQVVHMTRRKQPISSPLNEKTFFRIVKAGFSSRRKTLLNSLSGGLNLPKDTVSNTLSEYNINPSSRPQELDLLQWKKLAEAFGGGA
ncbi:ribosomal RNA small subunit methyltransferase A [Candidatus Saccharibacteria bacterium]|nr:ribosomal RNA small subunit methyltransferase A [Candidatus Saccharibacteria bacterium]